MVNRRSFVGVVVWSTLVAGCIALAAEPREASVRLVIDYGEGVEKQYGAIPWREGMTVRSALESASALVPPRGLKFESKGEGERAILLSIDGLSGEGAGAASRNWLFWVNDVAGERSFAVSVLQAGDVATWRFATYDALKPKG